MLQYRQYVEWAVYVHVWRFAVRQYMWARAEMKATPGRRMHPTRVLLSHLVPRHWTCSMQASTVHASKPCKLAHLDAAAVAVVGGGAL